ncbi:class I SAM-dependent methyltransferase [Marvinbryantia formatexigens]|nr:class I SAM-dependent methyltransferase [Marvinbryantia formatexigens]UWO23726.1 class I SAM-dependent methyltransferase [Marvinbryantia formatexigens DSM 14469]SDF68069.1 O-Methyltransferase involved in polyketide biosynthesis [Marvinbryantia formatexigens]
MKKVHIERNTVQETLVIPLYARKLCTEQYPRLFRDPRAAELMGRMDYDFSEYEQKSRSMTYRFGALETAMRQYDLAWEVRDYLRTHPKAAVVNLGCGLDMTGENCDNGQCRIYNLDFPEVIALREQLIPGTERVKNLAVDLNDTGWFDKIDAAGGAVFFAAGVFYYFRTEQAKPLFLKMADRFPGGRLLFDTAGKTAVKLMIKTWVKASGITDVGAYFYLNNPERDLQPWMENADISSRGYMLGYDNLKDSSVSGFFRFLSRIGDGMMKMRIVRLDFHKP